MPAPISGNSRSSEPALYSAESSACDPSVASCALPEKPVTRASVTLEPVEITGDLGTQHLIEQYDRSRGTPDCSAERDLAYLACANAASTALGAVAAAGTGIGLVAGVAMTVVQGVVCGKELAALNQCENQ